MSEMLIGKRERMSWIEETSWGSGGTMSNGEVVGYDVTITPDFSKGYLDTLSAGADNRWVGRQDKSIEVLNYSMQFVPYNWRWLKYLFDVSDTGSDPYTHTFSLADTLNSFKLEWAKRHTTNHVLTLTGNVVKSATLKFARAGEGNTESNIWVTLECIAKTLSQGSSVTTLSGGNPSKVPFQSRNVKLTLEGNEITEVNSGEMTITTGVREEDSMYCNSTLDMAIGEPIPLVQKITGRFNINIKDKTFFDMWDSEDALTGTNKLEIIRGADDDIVFTFTDFYVHRGVAPTTIDGVTNVTLVWQANSVAPVATDDIATY